MDTRSHPVQIADFLDKLPPEVRNYNHHSVLDEVSTINRELRDLHEKFLQIGVRSHILEVEVATQFSPDQLKELQKVDQSCVQCVETLQKPLDPILLAPHVDKNCTDKDVSDLEELDFDTGEKANGETRDAANVSVVETSATDKIKGMHEDGEEQEKRTIQDSTKTDSVITNVKIGDADDSSNKNDLIQMADVNIRYTKDTDTKMPI